MLYNSTWAAQKTKEKKRVPINSSQIHAVNGPSDTMIANRSRQYGGGPSYTNINTEEYNTMQNKHAS